jgi:hypothetical protein
MADDAQAPAPLNPDTYLSLAPHGATPLQLQMARDYALALAKRHKNEVPMYSPWAAVGDVAQQLAGDLSNYGAYLMQSKQLEESGEDIKKNKVPTDTGATTMRYAPSEAGSPEESDALKAVNSAASGSPSMGEILAPAVAGRETGGLKDPYHNVTSTGTGHNVYGKYQVEDINIAPWSSQILGKPMTAREFLNDPNAQETIAKSKLNEYAGKYGMAGAARAWLAGEGGMNNPRAHDRFGSTPFSYSNKVMRALGPRSENEMDPRAANMVAALQGNTADDSGGPALAFSGEPQRQPQPQPRGQQFAQNMSAQDAASFNTYVETVGNQVKRGMLDAATANKLIMDRRQQLIGKLDVDPYGNEIRITGDGRVEYTGRKRGPGKATEIPFVNETWDPRTGQRGLNFIGGEDAKGGGAAPAPADATGTQFPGIPHTPQSALEFKPRMEAAKANLTKQGEELAKRYEEKRQGIIEKGDQSQTQLPLMDALTNMLKNNPHLYTGLLANEAGAISQIAKLTGWGQGEMATAQQIAKKLGSGAQLQEVRQMGEQGAVRVPEMHMIEKSNYDPENTNEANLAVVETRRRVMQRSYEIAGMAMDYAQKSIPGYPESGKGVLNPGFDRMVRDHYEKMPLFKDTEVKHYSNLASHPKAIFKTLNGVEYYNENGQWYATK